MRDQDHPASGTTTDTASGTMTDTASGTTTDTAKRRSPVVNNKGDADAMQTAQRRKAVKVGI